MVHRIEVYSKVFDARAVAAKNRLLKLDLVGSDCDLWISDVYTIDKDFSHDSLKNIASMLANPVTQSFVTKTHPSPPLSGRETRNSPTNKGELEGVFTYAIEIGFLPGVTDNIATTARESIEDLLKTKFIKEENVYSSKLFFLKGN
ncbi:hypothetical protein KKF69_06945, partial [Patescibacteria group bacterium]|nr:hypothetical protein [Patescibacteria group bacterium]